MCVSDALLAFIVLVFVLIFSVCLVWDDPKYSTYGFLSFLVWVFWYVVHVIDRTFLVQQDAAAGILDDSSTSLISRKKVGGTTSYKRPGPPTPSKKAGRLSFGGSLPTNDFQYKEIQKDNPNGASTTAATLSSRLSFGGRKSIVDPTTAVGNNSGSGNSMTLAEMNARKKTPGKFKQMFSSSNLLNTLHKDEVDSKQFFPYYI